MQALGIYVFAGLFTRGLVDAGWEITGVLEDGNFGVKTHRANFPSVPIYTKPDEWPLAQYRDRVQLMYGNPPCAGFSGANSKKGVEYETNACLIKANRAGLEVRPDVFMIESVTNLFNEGDVLVREWEQWWKDAGYVTCRLMENGGLLGLPQNRKRAVFVAAKSGLNLDFEHGTGLPPTVHEAIWDLQLQPEHREPRPYSQSLEAGRLVHAAVAADPSLITSSEPFKIVDPVYAARMRAKSQVVTWHVPDKITKALESVVPYLPPGKRFEHVPDDIMAVTYWPNRPMAKKPFGRPSLMYRRLEWHKHCAVVTGQGMYFHPDKHRLLTVREQCRMMGVPDDFTFDVKRPGEAYREIGKAVSPIVGQWLGSQVTLILGNPTGREHKSQVNLISSSPSGRKQPILNPHAC